MSQVNLPTGEPCWMLTQRGLMPGIVRGYDFKGLCRVEAPKGKVYTTSPVNVLDIDAGKAMLAHARAEKMAAEGYEIRVRFNGTFRIFQPKKHGDRGGYIVQRAGEALTCSCPAYAESLNCKHQMCLCDLLRRRADRLQEAGKTRVASRYRNLAGVIHEAA